MEHLHERLLNFPNDLLFHHRRTTPRTIEMQLINAIFFSPSCTSWINLRSSQPLKEISNRIVDLEIWHNEFNSVCLVYRRGRSEYELKSLIFGCITSAGDARGKTLDAHFHSDRKVLSIGNDCRVFINWGFRSSGSKRREMLWKLPRTLAATCQGLFGVSERPPRVFFEKSWELVDTFIFTLFNLSIVSSFLHLWRRIKIKSVSSFVMQLVCSEKFGVC